MKNSIIFRMLKWLLRIDLPSNKPVLNEQRFPSLILDLDGFQVYTLLTQLEIETKSNQALTGVYWQNPSISSKGHGPFPSVYEACRHYQETRVDYKKNATLTMVENKATIIHVNFVTKRRL